MQVNFTKMQGCGNDYIYFYQPIIFDNIEQVAQRLSDRHFGIGADGLVFILPSTVADFKMRMFNADGSEGQMCGNATRCIAKYVFEKGHCSKPIITLETQAGIKELKLVLNRDRVRMVTVNLGQPELTAEKIPIALTGSTVMMHSLVINDQEFLINCVSMGNPHAVIFVPEVSNDLVHKIGPLIEKNPLFPARTNVEFVRIINRNTVSMRVWERGSGETLACGTGAAAVCVAAATNHLTERKITVQLRGGELLLEWAADNNVYKTGPAEFVFEGQVEI